jgi:hypothetical protein
LLRYDDQTSIGGDGLPGICPRRRSLGAATACCATVSRATLTGVQSSPDDDLVRAQLPATSGMELVEVRLTLIARDPASNPTGSPTLYRTDRGSWVVQGWIVTDAEALAQMGIPDGEACVEIPDRMIPLFEQAGSWRP